MMSYLQLWWAHLRVGVMNELQYRVNFFVQLFNSLLSLGIGLAGWAIVFTYTETLGGWSRAELLAVMGIHILVGGLINISIVPNLLRLIEEVRAGTLDYALVKPQDAQVLVSVRQMDLWQIVEVMIGFSVLAVAVLQLQRTLSLWQALSFGVALLLGGLMMYCLSLMLATLSFWFVRVANLLHILGGMYEAGRWPVDIYPDWLRFGLTFLMPVAFAVTIPAQALTGRLTPLTLGGAALFTFILLSVSRWFWHFGLRHYTGASA